MVIKGGDTGSNPVLGTAKNLFRLGVIKMFFHLILVIFCTLFSYLFACLVTDEWIDPFEGWREAKKRREIDERWRKAEAAYEREQERKWQEWKLEKERRAAQAVFTKQRQAQKAAIKAAKRAAHESRTLANKKRKEQARMEYSLRKPPAN